MGSPPWWQEGGSLWWWGGYYQRVAVEPLSPEVRNIKEQ